MAGVVANLVINISAKTSEFEKSLAGLEKSWARQGAKLKSIGGDLTRSVTLPLAGIAIGAVKMSMDFETAMTKVRTLASESASGIEQLRVKVLELAPVVGIGPTALADALLVIESTGFRGAAAMDILEMAAKGSAIGMGETSDVARAITAAVNAYGAANLSAAQAADILTATVDAGGAEASQLAGEIGRVVGVAAQLGVSFEQVGAFIATYTKLGLSAAEATTGLSGVLNMILSPSREARKALEDIGMSAEGLRVAVKEKGLDEALIGLLGKVKGNGDAVGALFGNVRALAGVMGTAGSQAASYRQILDQISHSTGTLNERFAIWKTTTAATWSQFTAQAQVAAIALGDRLAPAFSKILVAALPVLDKIVALIGAFGSLPSAVQTTTIGILAFTAAVGPAVYMWGNFLSVGSKVLGLVKMIPGATFAMTAAQMALTSAWGAVSTAILAALGPLSLFVGAMVGLNVAANSDSFLHWASTADEGLSGLAASLLRAAFGYDKLTEAQFQQANARRHGSTDFDGVRQSGDIVLTPDVAPPVVPQAKQFDAATEEAKAYAKEIASLKASTLGVESASKLAEALRGENLSVLPWDLKDSINKTMDDAIKLLKARGKAIPKAIQDAFDATASSKIDMSGFITDDARFKQSLQNDLDMADGVAKAYALVTGSKIDMSGLDFSDGTEKARDFQDALDDMGVSLQSLEGAAKEARYGELMNLGASFQSLGGAIGGQAGSIVSGLGSITQAYANYNKHKDDTFTTTQTVGAAIEGAAAVWQATSQGSTGQRMVSGAMTGLSVGLNPALMAATSGGSAVIGAVAGAMVGGMRGGGASEEDLRAGREMAEDWGRAMVDAFDDSATSMQEFHAAGDDAAKIQILIADNFEQMGLDSHVAAMMLAEVSQAQKKGPEAVDDALEKINDLMAQHSKIMKNWAEGVSQFVEGFGTRVSGFADTMGRVGEKTDETAESFARMGSYAEIAFATALGQSGSIITAIEAIQEPLKQLTELQKAFGFETSATFDRMVEISDVVTANADIFQSLDGLNQMMEGLRTATLLTAGDMQLFGLDATSMFDELVLRGVDANLAMALMQPTLQSLWEAQQQFGIFTDAATQALIDQAVAAGIVGEQQRDINEQLLNAVIGVGTAIGGVEAAIRLLPQAFADATLAAQALADTVGRIPNYEAGEAVPTGNVAVARGTVPSYANEGFVRRPTLAMIGDAPGGEYVLHKSTVQGLVSGAGGRGGVSIHVNITGGTIIGNSKEFEDAVTRGVNAGLERGGPNMSKFRKLVAVASK